MTDSGLASHADAGPTLTDPGPTQPSQRVMTLDVLRGIALAGILVVNVLEYAPAPVSWPDHATARLVEVVAEGSFFPLFSLLFGVGFAVFLDRASAGGRSGVTLYLRRLVALFGIAAAQMVMLEDRNILLRYALLGVPLLLFWRASARTLLLGGVVALALAAAHAPLNVAYREWRRRDPAVALAHQREAAANQLAARQRRAEWRQVAESRSYTAMLALRARRLPSQVAWSADLRRNPTLAHIFAMFLLGAAAWRAGLFRDPTRFRRVLHYCVAWGLLVGLAGNLAVMAAGIGPGSGPLVERPVTARVTGVLANTALTLAYAGAVVLWVMRSRTTSRHRLEPVARVGRMGLTNYLWQSVAMSVLFLSYGLGLDGRLPLWSCALVGIAIYLSHLPISAWWLRRFRYGPVEWVWRSLTYMRFPEMRPEPSTRQDSALAPTA